MIAGIGRVTRFACVVAALMCAVPALASAAQSLGVTSGTGFPAGGDPSYTTTINLDTSAGAPGKVTIALAPGALASPAANSACATGAAQYAAACQIGTGQAVALGLVPLSLNAYLTPPPNSADLVGIDLVPQPNLGLIPVTHIGAQLVQTPNGNVQTVLSLDLSSLGATRSLLTKMSLTINGTLKGKPFTRMPTNCSPGATALTIATRARPRRRRRRLTSSRPAARRCRSPRRSPAPRSRTRRTRALPSARPSARLRTRLRARRRS